MGAGFIEFGSIDQATEALEALNGREAEYGIKLNLSYAKPPKPRSFGGGRSHGSDWEGGNKSSGYGGGRGGGGRGGGYGGDRGGRY